MSPSQWRSEYTRQLAELRSRWQRLAPRERRVSSIAAVLLPGLLIWLALIEPALQRIEHWQQELPRLQSQARTLEQLLYDGNGPRQVGAESAEALLRKGLDAGGLAERYELQGEGRQWRLKLHAAPAPAVMDWLLGIASRLPLQVRQVQLRGDGQDTDDRLSGVVDMEWQAKESS